MSIFKKAAALVCSATTIIALGATMTASAAGPIEISVSGVTVTYGVDDLSKVAVTLNIANNPGYAASGIGMVYDERLTPVNNDGTLVTEFGPAGDGLMAVVDYTTERHIIGWTSMGMNMETDNGVMMTVYFSLPEDAQPGDVYPITLDVDQISDNRANDYEFTEVDGFIEVIAPETTTTTTTTTTEETTTTTEETTTTTEETTTSPGNDTGDAGVALAFAGLLTAAGTAVVVRKKRK